MEVETISPERVAPRRPRTTTAVDAERSSRLGRWRAVLSTRTGLVVALTLASHALFLAVAGVEVALCHRGLTEELSNWDGVWYLRVAVRGYPTVPLTDQSTLGFLPVYPMLFLVVARVFYLPYTLAALFVSGIGGLVATRNVYLLAERWWGRAVARRAVVAFTFFPGTIVFSMVYSEGLLLALVTGALWYLARRRYWPAAILTGIATGIVPDALALALAFGVIVAIDLYRTRTWRRAARAVGLVATALSGVVGFAAFLWAWTGTPLASLRAQRIGWGEKVDLLAIVNQTRRILDEFTMSNFTYHDVNWNLIVGELGVVFLVLAAFQLYRYRAEVPLEALVFTAGVSFLMVTAEFVPPNPRLLLTAFPLVIVFARRLRGTVFAACVGLSAVLSVATASLTFVGIALRP